MIIQRSVATATRTLCRQRITGILPSTIPSPSPVKQQHNATRGSERSSHSSCSSALSGGVTQTPLYHQRHGSLFANNGLSLAKPSSSTSIIVNNKSENTLGSTLSCGMHIRTFQNVGTYHDVADDTLYSVQDAVEEYLEEYHDASAAEKDEDIPEVNYASGVLTMYLPPHGTWIMNKQTPNQQIWWSSPISGPRRYEYDEGRERWVYSRVGDEGNASADISEVADGEEDTLGEILNKEFEELFGKSLGIDDDFHC